VRGPHQVCTDALFFHSLHQTGRSEIVFFSELSVVRLTSVFSGGKSCPKMIARRSLFSRRKIARLVRSFPSSCSVVTFSRGRSGVRGRSVRMSYTVSIIEVAIT
jgi:hypothetical protein